MRVQNVNGQIVLSLTPREASKAGIVANVVAAAPSAPVERTFATKAERLAGNGFPCPQCARNDLRVAPKSGSFHEKDAKTDAREKVICTIA